MRRWDGGLLDCVAAVGLSFGGGVGVVMLGGLRGALGEGVAGAKLGDEFAAVFGSVHGEGGGDGEEGGGEGADG